MKSGRTVFQAKRFGIFSCKKDQPLGQVVRLMVDEDISALVVVENDGALAGIITRTDLLRAYKEFDDWAAHPAEEFMAREVITVGPHTLLSDVACLLLEKHVHRVVVVHEVEGRIEPISVVSAADLVYHMAKDL